VRLSIKKPALFANIAHCRSRSGIGSQLQPKATRKSGAHLVSRTISAGKLMLDVQVVVVPLK